MLEIQDDEPRFRKLKIELSVTIDGKEPFVKAMYKLEGDGALAALHNHIWVHHYSNVLAVAKHLAIGNATHKQQLMMYAENCVTPAYLYFQSKFDNELKPVVEAFKATQYMSPSKVNELKPDSSDIDSMRIFPLLDSDCVSTLKSEFPSYLLTCFNVEIVSADVVIFSEQF